jgi:hypothetical protein
MSTWRQIAFKLPPKPLLHFQITLRGTGNLFAPKRNEPTLVMIPIKLDLRWGSIELRDAFCWNTRASGQTPLDFALTTCRDLALPDAFAEYMATEIQSQIDQKSKVCGHYTGGLFYIAAVIMLTRGAFFRLHIFP